MEVREHVLFPTKLLAINFPGAEGLNHDLYQLFAAREEFRGDFNMHPDVLNLLRLEESQPCIGKLRQMFLDGLAHWLRSERVHGELTVSLVLFPNYARQHEFTLVHNHNADVVGVYYVRTAAYDRPVLADPEAEVYDYFEEDDGVLVLHDPRFNANLVSVAQQDYLKVFPRPGLMLLFPGYLWHSVTPHRGDYRRLAISANFTLTWQEQPARFSWPLTV